MSTRAGQPREKAVRFGAGESLVGITCEPRDLSPAADRPGVLLLNPGIIHRIGACRLHVNVARALALAGFPTLRFDFSGIGDSPARRDALRFEESAPLEVGEAMDWLGETRGIRQFVVVGLCSGADVGFDAALQDERIAGLVQIDPRPYPTLRFYWEYYRARIGRLSSWFRFVRRHSRRLVAARRGGWDGAGEVPEGIDVPTYVREFPPRGEIARGLQALVDRGVGLLCIHTGGQADQYLYRDQFLDAFSGVRFGDALTLEYLPDSDHIITGLGHQAAVVERIVDWARARWLPETGASADPEAATAPPPVRAGAVDDRARASA